MDRLFRIVLRNKLLFNYIICIGRPFRSKNLLYYQIKQVDWILKNGYEGILWYKIKRKDNLIWKIVDRDTVLRYGSPKLFESIFLNQLEVDGGVIDADNENCLRDIIFPERRASVFLQTAIEVNSNQAAKMLLHYGDPYSIDQIESLLNHSIKHLNAEIANYIIDTFKLGEDDLKFKMDRIVIKRDIPVDRYHQFTSFLLQNKRLLSSKNSSLFILLIICGNREYIDLVYKSGIERDKTIIEQIVYTIYKILKGSLTIPIFGALEMIKCILSWLMGGLYYRSYYRCAEELVKKFTKLSKEDCVKVILFELLCGMRGDTATPITIKEKCLVKLNKIMAAINDCEDIDVAYLKYIDKCSSVDKRLFLSNSTSLTRMNHYQRIIDISNINHLIYLQQQLDLETIKSIWVKGDRNMMIFLSRHHLTSLIKLKEKSDFWSSQVIDHIDFFSLDDIEKLAPITQFLYAIKHPNRFFSIDHIRNYFVLFGSLELCEYSPTQNLDLAIVQFLLANLKKQSTLHRAIKRILMKSLHDILSPIVKYILDTYWKELPFIEPNFTKITSTDLILAKLYHTLLDSTNDQTTAKAIVESI
ncbi:hypothetical protein PPL_02986 [Heterostelium album PN500]|uniref:Uncharacterized protein n=1 Tax=Heterostelium pallidum (strain ATCC 26659 / Pp 5 / PN500) TaxID=670386 RepID=D3B3L8_HETP5|nr:hypothetical protein PPL_02986 [Heterostelium album PN500]EFA83916.1 hypothetical protein PPL_02986 [Heterostelium album PN500]|eukprot:XP_020436033.1 hypothetical protein PPL_02986 [Heterostelium album PN500]